MGLITSNIYNINYKYITEIFKTKDLYNETNV